ncbi:hypothetical protein OBBRIDRAFT_836733 [Obba rivulosa]|uniref:Uncharacterized protein n=1 Tax=Obba rivulosa TaxID=1052685 RepID=A0A8E2APJ3_9APHY|nr:hypothetical protein OBBRIDRAFT_836733 [Obba rivulosa]
MSLPSLLTTNVPVLRQPVGFGRNDPSTSTQNTYQATLPPAPVTQFLPGQGASSASETSDNISTKVKEKGKDHGPYSSSKRPPGARTAFRVQDYDHDPRASKSAKPQGLGPYRADFRVPPRKKSKSRASAATPHPSSAIPQPLSGTPHTSSVTPTPGPLDTSQPPAHGSTSPEQNNGRSRTPAPAPHHAPPATTQRPATSYYRHDYERERSSAPANNSHRSRAPDRPPAGHHQHPSTTSNTAYGGSYQYTGQPSPPDSVYATPSPAAHDEQYSPARHDLHASRASTSSQVTIRAAAHASNATPAADPSAKSTRVLRVLTLLIEDERGGKTENLLAEVRVPLKQDDSSQGGFWADAQDVAEALQSSTARIDGRAKVSTKRGKWKQVFLRVSPEDGNDSSSANLRITKERTLEVFVEDYPAPDPPPNRSQTPTVQRELLTPVTDTMASPSPGPAPSPQQFPMENLDPPAREYISQPPIFARKRLRSDASQSSRIGGYDNSRESPYFYNQPSPYEYKHQPSPVSQASPTDSEPSPHPQPSYYSPPRAQLPLPKRTSISYMRSTAEPLPSPKEMGLLGTPPSHPVPDDSSEPSSSDDEGTPPPRKRSRADPSESAYSRPTMTREVNWNPPRTASSAYGTHVSISAFSQVPSRSIFNAPSSQMDPHRLVGGPQPRVPSKTLPTAISHGPADTAVSMYLKSAITKEPGWAEFVRARNSVISVALHLEQYRYVESKFKQYISTFTPEDLPGAPNVMITKSHILTALGLKASWSDNCEEVMKLNTLYGAGGQRYEDPRVVAMLEETPPISTGMQVNKFLSLLREIHNRWTAEHPS